ncbi:hypothetical protein NQ317_017202 [Molorchus minor]|uniref:Reverse transcriptase domain-containing protein n=1 Tax=Molorchus minor TaxID=1323400 RepID=A0ABQ9J3F4_9CUCU|nr:hypothetical protein NQ317_017202 [Molorchus minor]
MKQKTMTAAVNDLLDMGAVVKCTPVQGQFISNIFLTDKSNGGKRFILNLKNLNSFIRNTHFKMEDYRTAVRLIKKNTFMTSLDLKDAYFLISVYHEHRKYLRFFYNNNLYEFTCLPFGLSSAPYCYTKLMKPVVTCLRSKGIPCVNYLDDFLILGDSYEECVKNIKISVDLISSLGLIINYEKSVLSPSKRLKFLGFIAQRMVLELPWEKKINIQKWAKPCPAVKYGWVYTKKLEREKFLALLHNNMDYNKHMSLSSNVSEDLNDSFSIEIFTDASLTGWGACSGRKRTHGFWSENDKKNHINYLELQAIYYGLKCFAQNLTKTNILIRSDNTTAISYINKMGSIRYPRLCALARKVWQWCEERDLWLVASYISSQDNWLADKESRSSTTQTEWSLFEYAFKKITDQLGRPEVDLFASKANHKCEKYVSWRKDPGAMAVDAFTLNWGGFFFYAFPPFALILRTLQKIMRDKAEGIICVPAWPSQAWYPLLLKLQACKPIIFEPSADLAFISFQRGPSVVQQPFPGSRHIIREALLNKNTPVCAINTIISSLSPATLKQYSGTYRLWWNFCMQDNLPVLEITANKVIHFMQNLLNNGQHKYGTFNAHRSALSIISPIDLGTEPILKRFMRGISKLRPPQPRYDSTWDPQIVLNTLRQVRRQKSQICIKKLATLLALTTGGRLQTISLIRVSNMVQNQDNIQVFIPDLIKTSGVNRKQPCLHIPTWKDNDKLCVATTLRTYIEATQDIRKAQDYLFLTHKEPHSRASKQTISRWVKDILKEAGIDTSKFKPHTTRHASTSTAHRQGVSIETICRTAGWSQQTTTFARFYDRPLSNETDFAKAVLRLGS